MKVFKNYGILHKAELLAENIFEKVDSYRNLKSEELKEIIRNYKNDLKSKKISLDNIVSDVYAICYVAIERVHKIKLFKVQLMGGIILNNGDIAQMRTGEGKTITALLPALLNSLTGESVLVVTVNEYLCKRDALNAEKVMETLGVTVGYISKEHKNDEKKKNYGKDIVYVTNSELGFDYLRDNMAGGRSSIMQKELSYCIIDEADSILIDESRTPLIISGGNLVEKEEYIDADEFAKTLNEKDYLLDTETRTIALNQFGIKKAEDFFGLDKLFAFENSLLVHRIQNALTANYIYKKDVDYITKNNEIVLVDIFTGRLLPGRSFSEGLNQAIEAKESVEIKPETKIMASITYQNLFRLFKKISGMTGTAETEEEEFLNIYNSKVIVIPTNMPIIRKDLNDIIFSGKKIKFQKIIEKIKEISLTKQPILVGTRSLYDSELISLELEKQGIAHEVLNAKNDYREADIIAKAGELGAITISTNMAGRGTDIKLGDGVIEKGGLFVLGTERHESRRIDDQLRGRAGRQGDIGFSQFLISLEDEILVRAGFTKLKRFVKYTDDTPITSRIITNSITSAQKRIEGLNYDHRKTTLEYDDVLNQQRMQIYNQRMKILFSKNVKDIFYRILTTYVSQEEQTSNAYVGESFSSSHFIEWAKKLINGDERYLNSKSFDTLEETINYIYKELVSYFEDLFSKIDNLDDFLIKRMIFLIDVYWREQLNSLSKLKQSIRYIQYSQKNPLQAYIFQANELFKNMKARIASEIINQIIGFSIVSNKEDIIETGGNTKIRETKNFKVK